ncbi:PepSY domain-containing protein [Planobispora siamensis]|nr:PepSY domain-containing protein [Planobispora siamensis]
MRKPVIVFTGLALAAIVAGGGVALAEIDSDSESPSPAATATPAPETDDDAGASGEAEDDADLKNKPAVLAEQAQRTALERVSGGWVVSAELGAENGTASWEVEVADGAGAAKEIVVDATTGKIVSEAAADADDAQENGTQENDAQENGQDDD